LKVVVSGWWGGDWGRDCWRLAADFSVIARTFGNIGHIGTHRTGGTGRTGRTDRTGRTY
jgi:hypothetical protein